MHDIDRIDAKYIKNFSMKEVKSILKKMVLEYEEGGELPTPEMQELLLAKTQDELREALKQFGSERFFKPSNLSDKTWQEQLEDLEWELEIDITGESHNTQEMLTTLNTALQMVVQPGFEQNKRAQAIVGEILELTGAMSPVRYNSIPATEIPQQVNEQTPNENAV